MNRRRPSGSLATQALLCSVIAAVPASPSAAEVCGDLDCSGEITASDALGVLRLAVGHALSSRCVGRCEPSLGSTTTSTLAVPSTTLPPSGDGPPAGALVISEIHADPLAVADGAGEWFEITNTHPSALDLRGVTIHDDGSDLHVIDSELPFLIEPGAQVALGRNGDPSLNGGVDLGYVYSSFGLSNGGDEVILSHGDRELDRVAYGAGFVVAGRSRALDPGLTDATSNDDPAAWCLAELAYGQGDRGTPGAANPPCS